MNVPNPPTINAGRPHLRRLMAIVQDHVCYSRSRPDHLANIASRLRISEDAALAYAIADQITEEFVLTTNGT